MSSMFWCHAKFAFFFLQCSRFRYKLYWCEKSRDATVVWLAAESWRDFDCRQARLRSLCRSPSAPFPVSLLLSACHYLPSFCSHCRRCRIVDGASNQISAHFHFRSPLTLAGGYPCPLSCRTINSLLSRLRCVDQSRRQIVVMSGRSYLHINWPEDERHERERDKDKEKAQCIRGRCRASFIILLLLLGVFVCLIYATIQKVKIQLLNGCQKPKQVTNVWGVAVRGNRLGNAL